MNNKTQILFILYTTNGLTPITLGKIFGIREGMQSNWGCKQLQPLKNRKYINKEKASVDGTKNSVRYFITDKGKHYLTAKGLI
jgi:hypothetical protein